MAISRSQMQRQLQNRGGITNLSPRQNFGLGSSLKKFVRKIIPNEVSKVASTAAPFVAPFNPALAGAMAGIGSFDQSGSLSDALKRGALTYGGGQLARGIGGGMQNLQALPGTEGFGGFGGFTEFSSPISNQGGLGEFFEQRRVANIGKDIKEIGEVQGLTGSDVGGNITMTESAGGNIVDEFARNVVPTSNVVPTETTFTESIKKIVSPNTPLSEKGGEALDLLKKGGKAVFTKPVPGQPNKTQLDKAVLFGTLGFALSYAEAKKLANDVGVDITESEYDEARKAEKQEQYANDLQDFFAGKKDGGRIGFDNGGIDMIALEENVMKYPEMVDEITNIEPGVAEAGEPVSPESTIFIKFDKEKEEADMLQEILRELEADGGRIGYDQGGRSGVIGKIADFFFDEEGNYSKALQRAKFEFSKFVSGMGTDLDTGAEWYNKLEPEEQKAIIEEKINYRQRTDDVPVYDERYAGTRGIGGNYADGGRIGLMSGSGGKKKYGQGIESAVKQINPLEAGTEELKMGGGIPMAFTRLEKSFLFKNLAKLGGADRSFTMPQLYRILSNPSKFPKDSAALKAFLKIKGYQKGGDVGSVNEIPVRTNEAGVKELDYRQSGGFVPVGVKEKADDVPAMLSKNEFVLTADAVRGIGGGSVEKGSEKLYNVMKQAEQVGKA